MNAVWSGEQQRCLAALGYTLYRASISPDVDASAADLATPDAGIPTHAVSAPPLVERAAEDGRDPLLLALLRAAHLDSVQVGDAESWLRAQRIPSLLQLRSDPAAKRAAWPHLRALRRERARR